MRPGLKWSSLSIHAPSISADFRIFGVAITADISTFRRRRVTNARHYYFAGAAYTLFLGFQGAAAQN